MIFKSGKGGKKQKRGRYKRSSGGGDGKGVGGSGDWCKITRGRGMVSLDGEMA